MRFNRKLVILPALVVMSAFNLVACGQTLTPAEYVAKANAFIQKGEFRSASVELSNALQQDPNALEARWLMGKVATELGEGARAEKEITKAMELGRSRTEALPTLVEAILLQGDLNRVLTETAELPADAPATDKALLLGIRGQVLAVMGQFDLARQALEPALASDPKSTQALVGMGVLHASQREYDKARQSLDLALQADPRSPAAWSTLGELELAQSKPADADTAFGNAIKNRNYPTLDRAKRALARSQLGNFKDAADDIRVLSGQGWGSHPYVNYVSGLIFFGEKNYAEAAKAFEASFNAESGFLPNRLYLATSKMLLGETAQALTHAQYVYSNAPRSPAAARLLGAIQTTDSEYAAAQGVLQTALSRSPEDTATLQMLATVSLLGGDAAKGVEYASKVAALQPQSREAQDNLMTAKLIAGQSLGETGENGAATSDDNYTRDFLRALAAFRSGKIGDALEQAKSLHTQHPDKVDPLNLLAAAYLATGQWDKAKTELEKVLKLQPNEPSAARNLAKIEDQAGNLPRAKDLLQGLVKERPGDESAALLLAEIEVKMGNRPASISVLEEAIKVNPGALDPRAALAEAYLNSGNVTKALEVTQGLSSAQFQKQPALLGVRGKAQAMGGDLTSARSTFEKWTKAAQDSAEAHFYLGDSLARVGELPGARKALERAVKLNPKLLPARVGEIKMQVQAGELEKAKKELAKLRPEFGERPEILGIEGWFALGTGDYTTAEQRFSTAMKLRPTGELAILLGRAFWAQKKPDQTIETLQSWLKTQPQDVAVIFELAAGYTSLDKNDEAIASYADIIKISPDNVPALNNLAWLNRDKDPKLAMEYAQRAYQLAQSDPHVLDTLGMLTLKNGNLSRAHSLVREAAERAPADPQIQLHLGRVLVQQGNVSEARKVLGALIKNAPQSAPGKEAKGLLDDLSASRQ